MEQAVKSEFAGRVWPLALILCAACGGPMRPVTGLSPVTQLEGLERDGMEVVLAVAVANHNDLPWPVAAIDMELRLDGEVLVIADWRLDMILDARGREVLTLPVTASLAGLEQLDALDSGTRRNLPWTLTGVITPARGRAQPIEASGYLHPVPGQPGRFR